MSDISIKGVDLSVYQNGIDYDKLKASGVRFAIIRAGFAGTEDKCLETHVKGCSGRGIDIGYYWFSYAKNEEQARAEAAACLKVIGRFAAPTYPVFFDGEENFIANAVGKKAMTDIALAFIAEIEKGGYPSGIYANPDWMETKYEKSRLVGKTDIWLAHWTWDPDKKSRYDYGQLMWQWGIESFGGYDADADICFIDYPAKIAEWYAKNGAGSNKKTDEELAIEVINGAWGAGVDRKQRLIAAGYDYDAVQTAVNRILRENKSNKPVDEIAVEVIRGLWGSGADRKQRLDAAGYDYGAVQAKVNALVAGE